VLVISPLVALMQDQVSHVGRRRGIPAACLHGGLDSGSRTACIRRSRPMAWRSHLASERLRAEAHRRLLEEVLGAGKPGGSGRG